MVAEKEQVVVVFVVVLVLVVVVVNVNIVELKSQIAWLCMAIHGFALFHYVTKS